MGVAVRELRIKRYGIRILFLSDCPKRRVMFLQQNVRVPSRLFVGGRKALISCEIFWL